MKTLWKFLKSSMWLECFFFLFVGGLGRLPVPRKKWNAFVLCRCIKMNLSTRAFVSARLFLSVACALVKQIVPLLFFVVHTTAVAAKQSDGNVCALLCDVSRSLLCLWPTGLARRCFAVFVWVGRATGRCQGGGGRRCRSCQQFLFFCWVNIFKGG